MAWWVATGAETAFGRVSSLTGSIERLASPLQRKLATVGRQLGAVALIICAAMVGLGVLTGGAWVEMMMAAISLAVAAVPEGLPTVVTITLALGIRQMVQRNVLLRRLSAAEALGATTVICTDKTGTLTQNEMTAQLLWQPGGLWHITGVGYAPEGTFVRDDVHTTPEQDPDLRAALEAARQCNNAALRQDEHGWRALGMPTEAALLVAAGKGGLELHTDPPAREHAFDSTRKRMSVVTHDGDAHIAYVKGAPEVIAARCTQMSIAGELRPLDSATREAFEAARADFAARGLRTLAVAMRRLSADTFIGDADAVEQELVLLGLWGIADPPRRDVAAALESAQHAGVDVIMITGDAPETALAIAEQVGLGAREALTGADLDAMPDDQISAALTPRRLALDRRRRPPRDDHPRGAQGDLVATPPRSDTSAYFAPYRVLLVNPARPHSALRPREVAGTLYALSHCIH